MSYAYEIEPAKTSDLPIILSFVRELAEYEKMLHEVEATEESLEKSLFSDPPVAYALMARVAGQAAGYAVYFYSHSTFLGSHGLYMEDLYIRTQFRGHGVGRGLLLRLIEIALDKNCQFMEWTVTVQNQLSRKFYSKLGARTIEPMRVMRFDRAALENILKQDHDYLRE